MNKSTIVIIVIVLVLVVLGIIAYMLNQNNSIVYNPNSQTNITAKVKFADSPDFQYSYLISTDNYDANTKLALTGFDVTKKVLSDGSLQIHLSAKEPGYTSQDYTLKPGQKLYFYERYLQDDQNEKETNLKDDKAILVDADGYVVE